MSFTLDNVSAASFAGASFLVESNSVTGGRKNIVHEFVNSDRQVIEDLGRKKRTYDVTAIITGDNYERDKRKLISVLESKDVGVLVHPFFGTIERIKPLNYTLNEGFSELGVAKFNIKFSISDLISVPTKAKNTASESKTKRDVSVKKANVDLKDKWKIPKSIKNGIAKIKKLADKFESASKKAKEKTAGIRETAGKIKDKAEAVKEKADELDAKINNVKDKAASIAQQVDAVVETVETLFYNLETAYDSAKQNFDSFKELFNFGDDDDEQLEIVTAKTIEVKESNEVLNAVVQTYALNFAYASFLTTDTTNSTIEEIEFQESILEAQYDKIILNSFQNGSLSLETLNSLTDSRATFNTVIKDIKTKVPNIEQVEILNPIPLRVIEYKYYGNTNRFDILKSINKNPNIEFYQGEVNLLNDNS